MKYNIRVRIDDFLIGEPNKKATHEQAKKALSYLEENNIKYYLGCVVDYITDEDIEFIKNELPNAIPVIHGFNHNFDRWDLSKDTVGYRNEFEGRSLDYLQTKLKEAKDRLSCFNIIGFIPPFNSFNQLILDVLDRYEFKFITTGPETLRYKYHHGFNYHNLKKYHSEGIYYSFKETIESTIHRIDTMPDDYLMCYHLLEIKC